MAGVLAAVRHTEDTELVQQRTIVCSSGFSRCVSCRLKAELRTSCAVVLENVGSKRVLCESPVERCGWSRTSHEALVARPIGVRKSLGLRLAEPWRCQHRVTTGASTQHSGFGISICCGWPRSILRVGHTISATCRSRLEAYCRVDSRRNESHFSSFTQASLSVLTIRISSSGHPGKLLTL